MNVLCFYKKEEKKKRLRENTIIGRNYELECNGDATSWSCALFVLRPFCSAPFLFCALFPCALFVLRLFCCALIVRALFAAPKCRGSFVQRLSVKLKTWFAKVIVTTALSLNPEQWIQKMSIIKTSAMKFLRMLIYAKILRGGINNDIVREIAEKNLSPSERSMIVVV